MISKKLLLASAATMSAKAGKCPFGYDSQEANDDG